MLLIFDLDGTLLNTIADLGAACNEALKAFGFPTHPLDEYPHMVGNGLNKLIERSLPVEARNEEMVLKLREVFVPYYNTHNTIHTRPYPGIVPLIRQLKASGHQLAVASNKYHAATQALVQHYFADDSANTDGCLFDVVFGERAGVERKPNPQIVYDIFEAIDPRLLIDEAYRREHVLYIGDSDVDIQTAKNAGVPCIACTWGFCTPETLAENEPELIVERAEEIFKAANRKLDISRIR